MHFIRFFHLFIECKKMGRPLCHCVLLKAVAVDKSNSFDDCDVTESSRK